MVHKRLVIGLAAAAVVAAMAGGAVAYAASSRADDEGTSVTGPEADRAVSAALAATGGGRANSVERDSEDGATWEVEVTKPDGTTVDVRLNAQFGVVVTEGDAAETPDGEENGD